MQDYIISNDEAEDTESKGTGIAYVFQGCGCLLTCIGLGILFYFPLFLEFLTKVYGK